MAARPITKAARHGKSLVAFLSEKRGDISPLLILAHDYPDPDTIASAYALAHLCGHFGIVCRMVYGGVIGRMENRALVHLLDIPLHRLRPADMRNYPHVALLDTQPSFANNSFPKNRHATIVIDQHLSAEKPHADFSIVDPEAGAVSVILGQALLHCRTQIPASVATALAYGILTDTMHLYRACTRDVAETYLALLPLCDLRALAKIQNPSRSRRFFVTLSKGIDRAMVRRGLIVSHLGQVENPDLVSQVADYLLTYRTMRRAFVTGRYKGKLHVSLRLENPHSEASGILRDVFTHQGQAGGHDNIAGGRLDLGDHAPESRWKEAENDLVTKLLKRLRLPVKGDFYYPFRMA